MDALNRAQRLNIGLYRPGGELDDSFAVSLERNTENIQNTAITLQLATVPSN